jgi:hypothetical protein
MRGWKVLATTALAANKNSLNRNQLKAVHSVDPAVSDTEPFFGRRKALQSILSVGVVVASSPPESFGLDMEAFANSQLAADKANCDPKRDPKCAPQLTADEAMCKYGQSGEARGEACKRLKQAGGSLPGASKTKSLGGAYAM